MGLTQENVFLRAHVLVSEIHGFLHCQELPDPTSYVRTL
jgi:hypothetical protein